MELTWIDINREDRLRWFYICIRSRNSFPVSAVLVAAEIVAGFF